MITIKFRGKRVDNKGWVYGYLFEDMTKKRHLSYIIEGGFVPASTMSASKFIEVIPETVGQFTGLLDKNSVEIYEGDIICDEKYTTWDWRGVIKYSHGVFGAEWLPSIKSQSMVGSWGQKHNLRRLDDDIIERIIKIGNIHDNPELLTK